MITKNSKTEIQTEQNRSPERQTHNELMNRWRDNTGRQTEGQMGRHTDRWTNRGTGRRTNRQTVRQTGGEGQTSGHADQSNWVFGERRSPEQPVGRCHLSQG